MSDTRLVKGSGILSTFETGDAFLADRRLQYTRPSAPLSSKPYYPLTFSEEKEAVSLEEDARTEQVANARVYINNNNNNNNNVFIISIR